MSNNSQRQPPFPFAYIPFGKCYSLSVVFAAVRRFTVDDVAAEITSFVPATPAEYRALKARDDILDYLSGENYIQFIHYGEPELVIPTLPYIRYHACIVSRTQLVLEMFSPDPSDVDYEAKKAIRRKLMKQWKDYRICWMEDEFGSFTLEDEHYWLPTLSPFYNQENRVAEHFDAIYEDLQLVNRFR
jgi:hypothetical protein